MDKEKYWEKKARKLEKEKQENEQLSGCLALVFVVVGLIVIALIS